jgi:hypothetical protein
MATRLTDADRALRKKKPENRMCPRFSSNTGKAEIRPESDAAIAEIVTMLT